MNKKVNFIPPEKIKCFDLMKTYPLDASSAWVYESDSQDFYFRVVLSGPQTIHVHSYKKDSSFYIFSERFRLNSMKTFHKRMEVFFAKMNMRRLNA